jgi:hypothetical protein
VLFSGLDDHDVPDLERELLAGAIDDHAAA